MTIEIAHGHGGGKSLELINEVVLPALGAAGAPTLDAARVAGFGPGDLAFSTDSFTIAPIFFPGGDIGKLAVCGTVNDLAVSGAEPKYLSLAFVLEEGFPIADLRRVVESVGAACREAGVAVVCGDTKVVERGKGDGVYVNVSGIGMALTRLPLGPDRLEPGDALLVSGTVGDHGAAILAARNEFPMGRALESDCALLWPMTRAVAEAVGDGLHAMRDPSRGGLAAALNEFALDARVEIVLREDAVPVRPDVRQFLEALGMDPFVLANEGKFVAFVAPEVADAVLGTLRGTALGAEAAIIGEVAGRRDRGRVVLETPFGTKRVLDMPMAEGLPRIC